MAYNANLYMPQYSGYQPMNWNYQPSSVQPVNGLVSVTGMEGAKAYQLPPNSAMPLFDKDSDVLYLKTTDSAGYPTIKMFAFQPVEQADESPAKAEFVSRTEFEALAAKVQELTAPKHAGKAEPDGK